MPHLGFLLMLCLLLLCMPAQASDASVAVDFAPVGTLEAVEFQRVVDGDTIEVLRAGSAEPVKVRMFAVECPELDSGDPQAFEAALFVSNLLSAGKVYLEIDEAQPVDHFDRVLAWVWYGSSEDELHFIQADLLGAGFATYYPKVQSDWYPGLAELLPQPGAELVTESQAEPASAGGTAETLHGTYSSVDSATTLTVRVDRADLGVRLAGLSVRPQYLDNSPPHWYRITEVQRWIDEMLKSRDVRLESVPGQTQDGEYLLWFTDNEGEFLLQAQLPNVGLVNIYDVDDWLQPLIEAAKAHPTASVHREGLKQAQAEAEEQAQAEAKRQHVERFHQIELLDHGLKWTRNSGNYNYYSWQAKLKNNTNRKIWVNCRLELLDADGFKIGESYIFRHLLHPGEETLREESLIEHYLARQVERYMVYCEESPY